MASTAPSPGNPRNDSNLGSKVDTSCHACLTGAVLLAAIVGGGTTSSATAAPLSTPISTQDPSLVPPGASESKPAQAPAAKAAPVRTPATGPATTPATSPATSPAMATPTTPSAAPAAAAPTTAATAAAPSTPPAPVTPAAPTATVQPTPATPLQPATNPLPTPADPEAVDTRYSVGGGYLHQFSASVGDGAEMGADRIYGSFTSRVFRNEQLTINVAMGYEFDSYQWSGVSNLGTAKPFDDVNLFGVQVRASFKVADEWTATVGGVFALAGESNADAGDSIYGGGLASIAYATSPDMVLGLGVLGVTQIENQPIIIPIPVLHWRFDPDWVLSSIRRPPASPFVGVDVAWEPEGSKVDLAVGIGWQLRRFRLDANSDPTLNNGVGEDESWAALFSVGYDIAPNIRIDAIAGTTFYEKLQLETSTGSGFRDATVSPNALLGIFGTIKF